MFIHKCRKKLIVLILCITSGHWTHTEQFEGIPLFCKAALKVLLEFFRKDGLHLKDLPLYFWNDPYYYWNEKFVNFGDYISLKLVERIVGGNVREYRDFSNKERKLLAIGSILTYARNNDIIWGSGINGKCLDPKQYNFTTLDIRAVRGPLTRKFLLQNFKKIQCPEVYGDPALLIPYLFPEFKRKVNPRYNYIIIPHYSEQKLFPKDQYPMAVYPSEPWDTVIEKITDSKFVIASSLHGIIIAEAFGIPACLLRITNNEPMYKYADYYLGTNRPDFKAASSVKEALEMGGEKPMKYDLKNLYAAFPREFWPDAQFKELNFSHTS